MKNIIALLTLCALFASCSNSQDNSNTEKDKSPKKNNHLTQYGINGNVKSITTKMYDAVNQTNNEWTVEDTNTYTMGTNNYNQDGFISSSNGYSIQAGQKTLILQSNTSFVEHKPSKTITTNVYSGTSETTKYSYETDKKYNTYKVNAIGKTTSKETNELNDNYLIKTTEATIYRNGDNEASTTMLLDYTYNSSHQLIKSTVKTMDDNGNYTNTAKVILIKYLSFDSLGNPTKQIQYSPDNLIPTILTVTEYTYYP